MSIKPGAQERAQVGKQALSGDAVLAGVPGATIVELPGANLYMFLTNEADVIREVRAFADTLRGR